MALNEQEQLGQHIVRADEVDQTGTDISPVPDEQLMPTVVRDLKEEENARKQEEEFPELPQRHPRQPPRPELRRDAVAPPPPLQPPPPAPTPQNVDPATDSLSLAQLRRIVEDLPSIDQQPAYAFTYADSQPFPDELDEWFQYNESDQLMLLGSKASFEQNWPRFIQSLQAGNGPEPTWFNVTEETQKAFIKAKISAFSKTADLLARIDGLESICYLVTGVWGYTAGKVADDYPSEPSEEKSAETPKEKSLQLQLIEKNIALLQSCNGIPEVFSYLQHTFDGDE